ncbi:hypothetical protein CN97_02840 [Haematobacter massiliensis]|uniref:Uncharacterized protein n=1 Tax=Haematobacter massiliensis TaxID=195105 RepID=A0A086XXA5_9RHOB|nr:hypothetical protein [Haematobacter massiliensis]KFI26655.1 hypothetical protein CN97_02840 [Haematobacter massiliensis]OWJ86331.1 hypothetical protein CDV51_10370 [Haematobacter massiliensis]
MTDLEIARLRAENERLQEMTVRLEKAEAERDTARAETAMAFEVAAKACDTLALADFEKGPLMRSAERCARSVRALTPADATAALAARDKATREQALRDALTTVADLSDDRPMRTLARAALGDG